MLTNRFLGINNSEMYQGMRRIIQMGLASGVLPDGTSESAAERRSKGIPNSQYSR